MAWISRQYGVNPHMAKPSITGNRSHVGSLEPSYLSVKVDERVGASQEFKPS